mmetsp:Transcript_32256/g.78456  ORF Transcript_32256/g.78456 Transcript_32256/m.78456 type:complete len:81 (+) Transcript_32256:570-812(+)
MDQYCRALSRLNLKRLTQLLTLILASSSSASGISFRAQLVWICLLRSKQGKMVLGNIPLLQIARFFDERYRGKGRMPRQP